LKFWPGSLSGEPGNMEYINKDVSDKGSLQLEFRLGPIKIDKSLDKSLDLKPL